MFEDIARDAEVLSNATAGWVTRRDAAERLGETAKRALAALHAHRADPDVDVRPTIEKALSQAAAGLAGVALGMYTLQDLANACAKTGERTVTAIGDGFEIEVAIKNGRRQRVCLATHVRKDGRKLVRVVTRCGPPTPESLEWALQLNVKLTHCALAIEEDGAEKWLVLTSSHIADDVTPQIVKTSVKEAAFYGDWVESKLTGKDIL